MVLRLVIQRKLLSNWNRQNIVLTHAFISMGIFEAVCADDVHWICLPINAVLLFVLDETSLCGKNYHSYPFTP